MKFDGKWLFGNSILKRTMAVWGYNLAGTVGFNFVMAFITLWYLAVQQNPAMFWVFLLAMAVIMSGVFIYRGLFHGQDG